MAVDSSPFNFVDFDWMVELSSFDFDWVEEHSSFDFDEEDFAALICLHHHRSL